MDTNASEESNLADIYVKEEITDQMESNIYGEEKRSCKRSYYQCITCQATFTKAEKLKDHESIRNGEKSKDDCLMTL